METTGVSLQPKHILTVIIVIFYVLAAPTTTFATYICTNEEDCPICQYEDWDYDLKIYVNNICEEYDIDKSYVLAIIWNESRFSENAIGIFDGYSYSYGPMQIEYVCLPFIQDKIPEVSCMEDLLDNEINIKAGLELLSYHKEYTETNKDMILRYQVGEGTYRKYKHSGINSTKDLENVLFVSEMFNRYFTITGKI